MADEPTTVPSVSAVEHSNGSAPGQPRMTSPSGPSPLVAHARRELNRIAVADNGTRDEEQHEVNQHILKMITIFAKEGHSGFSAGWATSVLNRLLQYKPLTPLQGTPDEWVHVGDNEGVPVFQNSRYGCVFKEGDGQAYDIETRVYDDGQSLYQRGGDRQPITFPYSPPSKPEVIKVNAEGYRTFQVDYVYDPANWECTYEWGEKAEMIEDRPNPSEPYKIATLVKGPDLYVISLPISFDIEEDDFEEFEDFYFVSEEEAKKAQKEAMQRLRDVAHAAASETSETGDLPSETDPIVGKDGRLSPSGDE